MDIIKQLKAISDETRLRIFFLLLQYELNVNEIVSIIGMIQSGISRHLKILMESGLLSSRKDGSFIYYSGIQDTRSAHLIKMVIEAVSQEKKGKNDILNAERIIRERQYRTQRFFKQVAKEWDLLKKQVIGQLDINRIIIGKTNACKSIADLGCGTGELLEQLGSSTVKKLIGVDSSVEMLEQARKKLTDFQGIDLRLGELEHLPMKNEETHCIILNMVLHHISMPLKVIREISRVMKPGGVFILSDFEKHDQEKIRQIIGGAWLGFDSLKVESWLNSSSFELDSIERYPVNHGLYINVFSSHKK